MHDPRDDDIVDLGRPGRGGRGPVRRLRLPDGWPAPGGWRPSRGAAVFAAAALVVGLVAGYAAGNRQVHAAAPAAVPAPTAPGSASPAPSGSTLFPFAVSSALIQGTGACSAQSGRHLALGVEFSNSSAVPVTLRSVRAVLPLGGLTAGAWHWTPCGALPQALAAQGDEILQPGASTWLTMTFTVKVGCPGPLPVQFAIGYVAPGYAGTATLAGFPDLAQVPYTGCPNASG
jgi:hypothetical protein